MWLKNIFPFIACTLLQISNAFITQTSENKELIYDWKAEIKSGTYLPEKYASQFILSGKLYFQRIDNESVFVKIANLKEKTYNGIMNHVKETTVQETDVPDEVQDLGKTFKIVYNDSGLVDHIVTESDEKEFSRNIKRAIASIFQINVSLLYKQYSKPETFHTTEESIYGFGGINCSIYPQRNGGFEVHKIQNLNEIPRHLVTNGEFEQCDGGCETVGTYETNKKYKIIKQDGGLMVTKICTTSSSIYNPFRAESIAQFVEIAQTFQLDQKLLESPTEYKMQSQGVRTSLAYSSFLASPDGAAPDLTNGRSTVNYRTLIPIVEKLLTDMHQYLQNFKIGSDIRSEQLVNQIHPLLLQFGSEGLRQLHESVKGESLPIFYHILPLIDTEASQLLIRDLILNKSVSDEIGVKLLVNMGEKGKPSLQFLEKLEGLIRLNNSYSWKIRKIAILRFGTLVHKSGEESEKYVKEYISRLKNSTDPIVQQIFIFGLHNMRAPSVAKLLLPAVFSGFDNDHLRYLSLWAAAACNSGNTLESLWPILTDTTEKTDIRILAYIYIMQTRPSLSTLKTLSNYMITEPDQELYHFHYTYLEAVMGSQEPCLQDFRFRTTQVLKFSPVPRFGVSSANYFGYTDPSFEFSTGFHNYFIKTNESRSYNAAWKSQQFGRYQEEYSVYFKIFNTDDVNLSLSNTIADSFDNGFIRSLAKSITNDKTYIEGAILKRGQVVDTYYFSRSSGDSLFLKLFGNSTQDNLDQLDLLHFNYFQYHKIVVPTDLGTPLQWEFLMPNIHQTNLKFKLLYRQPYTLDFFVDVKLITSIHYRHGLSFYNPISDVWQGVSRYQYFDGILPIRFAVSYSPIPETFKFTFAKLDYSAGLRSFVKQVVFVRNGTDEESQIVDSGEKFRHNYTLLNEDDPNTGLNLCVTVQDSTRRISNGTFNNLLNLFTQTSTKQFTTPIGYLFLTVANLFRYTILLPKVGTYGIVAKAQSSRQYPVKTTELSLKYALELDTTIQYAPAINLDFILAFSAKNETQNMREWTAEGRISLKSGHTGASIDIQMTKSVADHEDYKVCLNGSRKFTRGILKGRYEVQLGPQCSDDGIIEIDETGRRSADQLNGQHEYGSCQNIIPYSWPRYYTRECLISYTTLRHYTYGIKTQNLSKEVEEYAENLWGYLKTQYLPYCASSDSTSGGNLTLDLTFPMEASDEVDVELSVPGKVYSLTGVPVSASQWFGMSPESAVFPKIFQLTQSVGINGVIYPDRQYINNEILYHPVSSNWTLIDNDTSNGKIYIKSVENATLVLKIDIDGHILQVTPNEVIIDGDALLQEEYYEDWLYYRILGDKVSQNVLIFLPTKGSQFIYYGDRVEFAVVDEDFLSFV